jgi:transcriptional regulator with XRE-family HTH domain
VASQSFGDLLRTHRLAVGLTQEAVAERAGLSVHAIQKLERGVTHPYRDTTHRLVAALRLSGQEEVEFKELGHPAARHRRDGGPEHAFEFPIARPDLPVALDDKHGTNFVLLVYGLICGAEHQPERGLRVAAATVAYAEGREGTSRHWPVIWREFVERCELEVRASHGEAAIATAWEEGRMMSLEEVVAYVEGNSDS